MDIQVIQTLVGSLGFPIACSLGLFWYLTKEQKNHKEEMESLKESLNANTLILTELKMLIQNMRGDEHQ